MTSLLRLAELLRRHATTDGIHATAIPGVGLIRTSAPTLPMPAVYQPTLCLVAQGRKRAVLGSTSYVYDPAQYLVASVELPVMGSVIEASVERPYLCLVLDLDMACLSELALRHPVPAADGAAPPLGLALSQTTPQLLDAAVRLAALLDTPEDIAELAPMVQREIFYRLLTEPGNRLIRHLAQASSHLNQIARAIAWIRARYTEAWNIDDVAAVAGMSRSSFHAHFKAVTSMSPLEFRTQLRLQEARRRMVAESLDAASAGFEVGYESPSQFSRDYGRAFGMPPAKDAQRLRWEAR
ncbi:AraC family transcriptional regulator [Paracidovorax valerianellae]|uniref:AraC-type DNA-binding protein n=1 Tax=Paracidovorax valerianellae TaxID=187868 RepID=A0A1G7AZL8_9BURK|nr:AraC family transcriptional regulator [Paracidovorax valerianellae]MDA8445661.1 AraC family transcriptional regulator [Paracidovorax valerianellae]SDE20269.1 AraC-type DNA-binding protein [Paracidovorax valerianellae]